MTGWMAISISELLLLHGIMKWKMCFIKMYRSLHLSHAAAYLIGIHVYVDKHKLLFGLEVNLQFCEYLYDTD
jgi:hypothetical protein